MWVRQIFRRRYRTIRCMNGLRKFLAILIMLFSVGYCSYYCYGQSSQTLDLSPPKGIFDELNQNLDSLEQNLVMLKTENENLRKQLETLETLQKEQTLYSTNLELQSKALEKKYKFWKTTSIISVSISVPVITITTISLIVKNNIRP